MSIEYNIHTYIVINNWDTVVLLPPGDLGIVHPV